jgi:pyruvate dehydrogenase E1 component
MPGRRGLGANSVLYARGCRAPSVTVLDGYPHTLALLAGIHGVRGTHLCVTSFGQGGALASVYRHHGLDRSSIVGAALDLID